MSVVAVRQLVSCLLLLGVSGWSWSGLDEKGPELLQESGAEHEVELYGNCVLLWHDTFPLVFLYFTFTFAVLM